MNGVGTLIFIAVTKAKSPAYLGSASHFLHRQVLLSVRWDIRMHWEDLLRSVYADVFCVIIYKCGTKWIDIVLPPRSYGTGCCVDRSGIVWFGSSNAGLLDDKIDPKECDCICCDIGRCCLEIFYLEDFCR